MATFALRLPRSALIRSLGARMSNASAVGGSAEAASAFLTSLADSVEPLRANNPDLKVDSRHNNLKIFVANVSYEFAYDDEQAAMDFVSGLSGGGRYLHNGHRFSEWKSVSDGHDCYGLFLRDVLRTAVGMPVVL